MRSAVALHFVCINVEGGGYAVANIHVYTRKHTRYISYRYIYPGLRSGAAELCLSASCCRSRCCWLVPFESGYRGVNSSCHATHKSLARRCPTPPRLTHPPPSPSTPIRSYSPHTSSPPLSTTLEPRGSPSAACTIRSKTPHGSSRGKCK